MDTFTGHVPVVTAIISVFASLISVCFLLLPFLLLFCAPPLTPRHLSAAKNHYFNKTVSATPPNAVSVPSLSPLNAESTIAADGMVTSFI